MDIVVESHIRRGQRIDVGHSVRSPSCQAAIWPDQVIVVRRGLWQHIRHGRITGIPARLCRPQKVIPMSVRQNDSTNDGLPMATNAAMDSSSAGVMPGSTRYALPLPMRMPLLVA